MSVAVVGAGAIGLMFGAEAAMAGQQVIVCSRRPFDGIELRQGDAVRRAGVEVVTDPHATGPVDWVLLATKAHDVASTAPWLTRLCGPDTTVVVLQNGVEQAETTRGHIGRATVLPGLVYMSSHRTAPGRVTHTQGNSIVVPAGDPAARFAALLDGSPIQVRAESDFQTAAWLKLMTNVGANPITTLTERPLGVLRSPDVRALSRQMLMETVAVGHAEGAALDVADVARTIDYYASAPDENSTSMLDDRKAGRPLEHEHLTGAVIRLGRVHDVPTPATTVVHTLLAALSEPAEIGVKKTGQSAPDVVTPNKRMNLSATDAVVAASGHFQIGRRVQEEKKMNENHNPNEEFLGNTVVVTGAASGVGAATAQLFAARGAAVALIDLNGEGLAQTEQACKAVGAEVISLQVDQSSSDAVRELLSRS